MNNKKEKNKGGRPKIVWSDEKYDQFEALCQIQCTEDEICSVMKVTDKTLTRLLMERYGEGFSDVYKKFSGSGKASLRRWQFDNARKGNATMQIWLGRQYLGQSERQDAEHQEGGGGITINISPASAADVEED